MMDPGLFLQELFDVAVSAAQPALCLSPHLPRRPKGRTVVVGTGKASAEMARVVEARWDGPLSGLVVTQYGHGVPCRQIEIVEAAHPVPDAAGAEAAQRILETVSGLTAHDLVICLISGGGSALLALPAAGLTPEDKKAVNRELLHCGANITEMNCVRKHLSANQGRAIGNCSSAGTRLDLGDLRRAGRRPGSNRLRSNSCRFDDLCRCARDHRTL